MDKFRKASSGKGSLTNLDKNCTEKKWFESIFLNKLLKVDDENFVVNNLCFAEFGV